MLRFATVMLILPVLLADSLNERNEVTAANVNKRYVVESVDVPAGYWTKLSAPLRTRIGALRGASFDAAAVDEVTSRIRQELRNRVVVSRVQKGTDPNHVRVAIEITRKPSTDASIPKLIYHSKQNFSFGVDLGWRSESDAVSAGALTDNDRLAERYSGVRGGYQHDFGRVSVGVDAAAYRSQWNGASRDAARADMGLYRTRQMLEPGAEIEILQDLTLQLGVSMARMELEPPFASNRLSSAALGTLRFRRRWGSSGGTEQFMDASYGVRSGTGVLGGDYSFTRHQWDAGWTLSDGDHHGVAFRFTGGRIGGQAPVFERFVLGNSRTLRGYNKFDLAPLGADRMAHTSIDARWRVLRMVYDTGALWSRRETAAWKHSVGVGIATGRLEEGKGAAFTAMVAFPVGRGAIEPVFMTGIDF